MNKPGASTARAAPTDTLDPIEFPLDLPDRHVGMRGPPRPDLDAEVVVEPAEPGLRDLVRLQIGPGSAGEPGLGVDQRSQLAIDQHVVFRPRLRVGRRARVGVLIGAEL